MGHEKTRFTAVLACMADGTKLRPVVIFKRKTLPKNVEFVPGVIVQAHPKGWMDEAGTQQWLRQVWNARPGAMIAKRLMLVWDMFRAHVTESCRKTARDLRRDTAVIPGGLTLTLRTSQKHNANFAINLCPEMGKNRSRIRLVT